MRPGYHNLGPQGSQIFHKHGQKSPGTDEQTAPSGNSHRHCGVQGLPFSGAPNQPARIGRSHKESAHCVTAPSLSAPGKDDILLFHHTMGLTPQQTSSVVSLLISEVRQEQFIVQSTGTTRGDPLIRLVGVRSSNQGLSLQRARMSTDASLFGWGEHMQSFMTQGQ